MLKEYAEGEAMGGSDGRGEMSRTAPQKLMQQQQAAARNSTKRFAGGGYAIK